MKKNFILLVTLILVLQTITAQQIDSVLTAYNTTFPAEKIYIQYDKDNYVVGETIWFKAYLYSNGKPSGISTNFYLQLLSAAGDLIRTDKYPVLGATVTGNMLLPDSLPQGNYFIRAFTPYMLNGEESFLYKKNIFVFHPGSAIDATKIASSVSLQFFPESGNLVDGLLTVVAFKAVDQVGTPVDLSGLIKSDDGMTVAPFKTMHDGIGKINMKPQAGKKYYAEVETAAGPRKYNLPEVALEGISFKVLDEEKGKKFQLFRSKKGKELFENLIIVATINNQLVYETEVAFEGYPSIIGHLLTDSLPSGILHFTVFTQEGLPLAERLSFVNNEEYKTKGDFVLLQTGLNKRELNEFQVQFIDTIQRSCSVSIIDNTGNNNSDIENIYSRLLLTSDLKGYIYNPAYYFLNSSDSVKQALDNLLLTHGWSRYKWERILKNELPSLTIKDEHFLQVAGKVMDEKEEHAISGGKLNIYLEAEDSTTQNFELMLPEEGTFLLDSIAFLGKAKFFYAYTDAKGKIKPVKVIADVNELDKVINRIPRFTVSDLSQKNEAVFNANDLIDNRYTYTKDIEADAKLLENVNIKSVSAKKPFDVVNEKYTTGVFRTDGKVNLDVVNQPPNDKSINAIDFIKNRVQQLEVQGGRFVNRKNMSLMSGQKWTVGIFVNEQPADFSLLQTIRAKDLALVKFYEAGFVGVGSGSPGGALAVYTKEKFMEDVKPDKLNYFERNGYTITKEFYNPDYSIANNTNRIDRRTTLLWNPGLFTDTETNSLKFKFYNNDISHSFSIIVEGFDANGRLIHFEKHIQ